MQTALEFSLFYFMGTKTFVLQVSRDFLSDSTIVSLYGLGIT